MKRRTKRDEGGTCIDVWSAKRTSGDFPQGLMTYNVVWRRFARVYPCVRVSLILAALLLAWI